MYRERIQHDHDVIDRLMARLARTLDAGEERLWNDLWQTLRIRLDEHFRSEERVLFPHLKHAVPGVCDDLRVLCAQHHQLRVEAKGVADAGSRPARQAAFSAFQTRFSAHTAWEAKVLHRATDARFSPSECGDASG